MRLVRALVPALVTAICLGLASAPADGAVRRPSRVVTTDAAGDMWRVTPTDAGLVVTPAPEWHEQDLTSVSLHHRRHRLILRLHLAQLTSVDYGDSGPEVDLLTPRGRLTLIVTPTGGGSYILGLQTPRGLSVTCRGDRARFRPALDLVRFTVPRRCLGDPRWVRVSATTTAYPPASAGDDFFYYQDFAPGSGTYTAGSYGKRAYAPRRARVRNARPPLG